MEEESKIKRSNISSKYDSEIEESAMKSKEDFSYNLRVIARQEFGELNEQPAPYTSNYYCDLTRENNYIRSAFEAGHFVQIRDLPNQFHYKGILESKREQVERGKELQRNPLQKKQPPQNKVVKLIGGGYFSPFTYATSEYDFAKQIKKEWDLSQRKKRKEIAPVDFKPSDENFQGKWEDPFRNRHQKDINEVQKKNERYIFPSYLPGDSYDCLAESKARQRVIETAKQLAGDFLPFGQEQTLNKLTKASLFDAVNQFRLILEEEYPKSKFLICVDEDDYIQVIFKLQQDLDDPKEISLHMHTLLSDERICSFALSKVHVDWSKFTPEKNTLSFTLKPPWIKTTSVQQFYELHNELIPKNTKLYKIQ